MTMLKHGRVLLLSLDNLPTNLHSLLYVAILLTTIPQLGMVACHDDLSRRPLQSCGNLHAISSHSKILWHSLGCSTRGTHQHSARAQAIGKIETLSRWQLLVFLRGALRPLCSNITPLPGNLGSLCSLCLVCGTHSLIQAWSSSLLRENETPMV